ncbi:MAG: tripartite tricarboxylate transporter substrate binding protein [Casimicrobiaceae bacterium]
MSAVKFCFCAFVAVGALATASPSVAGDNYPDRPIKLIVAYPAGGANDIVARSIGSELAHDLGQPIVVENVSGAGGSIGAGMAAHAPADGYTLFMAAGAHALAPSLRKELPYDMIKSFEPISLAAVGAYALAVNPQVKAKNVQELIALAKSEPGKLNFGSSGVGAPPYLAAVVFQKMTGTRMTHVPYRGDADANAALLAGQVDLLFASLGPSIPLIQSGKFRALAVTTARRSAVMPDLPTLAESGLTGYNIGTWWGLVVPAGTPKPIIDRLAAAMAKATASPSQKVRFEKLGVEAQGDTPAEFGALIKRDMASYAEMTKAAGIEKE